MKGEGRAIFLPLFLYHKVMEQGKENGLIILTDGTLSKPTQYTKDTKKGCTSLKCSAFESGGYEVPH